MPILSSATNLFLKHGAQFSSLCLDRVRRRPLQTFLLLAAIGVVIAVWRRPHPPVLTHLPNTFPQEHWSHVRPKSVGISDKQIRHFSDWVGGEGIVIRHGYETYHWGKISRSRSFGSAAKPLISALLCCALKDGLIKSVDDSVAKAEPRLAQLNQGKDAAITWRQLACMTSGYGLSEKPGEAFAYNDDAIALYLYTLTRDIFFMDGTNLLHRKIARRLDFEDPVVFYDDFAPAARGLASISVQDMARFGLLMLRGGRWGDKEVIPAEFVKMMLESNVPESVPISKGVQTSILKDMPTIGAGRNQSMCGPGFYSFNWWRNRPDKNGIRPLPSAPEDAFIACGIWGKSAIVIIPSLDVVAAWNQSERRDFQGFTRQAHTRVDHAVYFLCKAVKNPSL